MAIYVRDESGVLQTLRIPAYKGEKGEAGITPNIQIGDVITLESGQQATVVRRGDDENPIFDFAIPKGEDGKDGIFVGSIDDAPEHAQIVINDDPSPYDLFYEDANVSYMGDTYTSLKEKADADMEYLLRKFGTQHYEGVNITATDTYAKQVTNAMFKGQSVTGGWISNTGMYVIGDVAGNSTNYGKLSTNTGDNVTELLPVPDGFIISGVSTSKKYCLYDKDGKHLTSGRLNGSSADLIVGNVYSKWENAKYIRFGYTQPNKVATVTDLEGNDLINRIYSVKSPTVTMIGKNLIKDIHFEQGSIAGATGQLAYATTRARTIEFIKLNKDMTYTFSVFSEQEKVMFREFLFYSSASLDAFKKGGVGTYKRTFTYTPQEDEFCRIVFINNTSPEGIVDIKSLKLQLEAGSIATSYEPYQSNILTLDGEYRGIGDVCDIVDLVTGEKVERIAEIVLDGSEKWDVLKESADAITFRILFDKFPGYDKILCNSFKTQNPYTKPNEEGIWHNDLNQLQLTLLKTKVSNVTALKTYLAQNNIIFQHQLATPIVKPIDLKNQKIYSYDDTTHYTTFSLQGHPAPTLSIDVPTNTTKMIARQREEIEQQEQQLLEQEEVQNLLIESQLAWFEDNISTLELTDEETPSHIQKLYELTRKRKVEEE